MKRILAFIVLAALCAPAQTASNPALPSEQTVDSFIRHMFGYDPNLKWQIAKIEMAPEGLPQVTAILTSGQQQQALKFFIAPDGKHAIQGETVPFAADPFAETRKQLAAGTGPTRGPADAPLTIVEFGDLQCPSCRQAQPTVEKLLADNPNAKFVFENFPLDQHPWAFKAATYGDCVARADQAAFWKFSQSVYDAQNTITPETADEKLTDLATKAGVDGAKMASCSKTPETKQHVDASLALGRNVGVTGTPTLFVNGRKINNLTGMPYDMLNRITQFSADKK